MVLRMLRVALPTAEGEDNHLLDGQALALLQAVGGFQAYRRSVPAPPNARPGRALPALRARLPGLGRVLDRGAAQRADRRRPVLPQLAGRPAALAADGRPRLPRPLAGARRDASRGRSRSSRASSALVDSDIAGRYFGNPAQPAARPVRRMNFAIRYLTEYRYSGPVTDNLNALRVKPATLSNQSVEDFVVRVDPETRLNQHLDYFGTTVIEFGISRPHEHLSIDVRARVRTTSPGRAAGDRLERDRGSRLRRRRGRVPAARRLRARRRGDRRPRRPDPRRVAARHRAARWSR